MISPVPTSHDAFHLAAQSAAVGEARRRVRTRLREWGADDAVCDDAGLIVSELFTNAVRYSGSDKVACAVSLTAGLVHLEVADQGYGITVPHAKAATPDAEGGRGLLLVGALSSAWGVRTPGDGSGRVVWAEIGRP
jgi:anti-sigma regulatory factor (Ser/Thr protein kinase)